jgi:hypothetical protein
VIAPNPIRGCDGESDDILRVGHPAPLYHGAQARHASAGKQGGTRTDDAPTKVTASCATQSDPRGYDSA